MAIWLLVIILVVILLITTLLTVIFVNDILLVCLTDVSNYGYSHSQSIFQLSLILSSVILPEVIMLNFICVKHSFQFNQLVILLYVIQLACVCMCVPL